MRRYEPRLGDDGFTFGNNIWRGGLYHIERLLKAKVLGVSIERPNNHIVITLANGIRLSPYRTEVDTEGIPDFQMSRSRIRENLAQRNSISFFEYSAGFTIATLPVRDLVILHDGDMREGFRGLWLGTSINVADLEQTEWLFLEAIYERDTSHPDDIDLGDDGDTGAPLGPPKMPKVTPFTERELPNVAIGAKNDVDEADATRCAPGADR